MAGKDGKKNDINKILDKVEKRENEAKSIDDVTERLASAAKASEQLSSAWSLPPMEMLRFHGGVQVADVDGSATPGWSNSKDDAERFIDISSTSIARYQNLLYANGVSGSKRRLLIVLQGMDAAGKGGIVKHVFSQGDPMGIHYHGFGAPSKEDLAHNYLWRVRKELPKDGWIAVFDRSHYEDIVMPHIYGTYPEDVWRARYDEINQFEKELTQDGCAIIKIFLCVSKDEQKKNFLERLDDPTKYWKFDPSDLDARDRWDEYMGAWQEVFEKTSTDYAPWYLVPADNRWYSRAVVSEMLRNTLRNMNQTWPPFKDDVDPDAMRARLESEGK